MALLMEGVKNANGKFQAQFAAVDKLPCLARVRVSNISPTEIHTPLQHSVSQAKSHRIFVNYYGAQVIANAKINIQAEMTITKSEKES